NQPAIDPVGGHSASAESPSSPATAVRPATPSSGATAAAGFPQPNPNAAVWQAASSITDVPHAASAAASRSARVSDPAASRLLPPPLRGRVGVGSESARPHGLGDFGRDDSTPKGPADPVPEYISNSLLDIDRVAPGAESNI